MAERAASSSSSQTQFRWRSEKTAAFLSRAVAEAERDPDKSRLFRGMADAFYCDHGLSAL